jgi:hypothetical protein
MPTLSIIIPTRNRPDKLSFLLQACNSCKSADLEFVVADNSDEPFDLNAVYLDSRFKIVRSDFRLSMTSNWVFGLDSASGNWRVFLGDDDGVIPSELDLLVERLRQSSEEAIVTRFAHFTWPAINGGSGRISIWQETKSRLRWTGLKGNSYLDVGNIYFPIPYARTIFSQGLEARIKSSQGGRLFTATSPDINLGAAITLVIPRPQILQGLTPFIVGTSTSSNGAQAPHEATKLDFKALNSINWMAELGQESLVTNYLSYVEPIAQARMATGLDPQLPNLKVILWKSLISSHFHAVLKSDLLRFFPHQARYIRLVSPFAWALRAPIRIAKLTIWSLCRSALNGEKYSSYSSKELWNSQVAAVHLQKLINDHREANPSISLQFGLALKPDH